MQQNCGAIVSSVMQELQTAHNDGPTSQTSHTLIWAQDLNVRPIPICDVDLLCYASSPFPPVAWQCVLYETENNVRQVVMHPHRRLQGWKQMEWNGMT